MKIVLFGIVGMKTCDLMEPTTYPYWRYRTFTDVSYPMKWRNGRKITEPSEVTSTIWNFKRHLVRTYHCESLHQTLHFLELLKRVTPVLNKVKSTLKLVEVIHQSKFTISDFILIYQQPQMKLKNLELSAMNVKMAKNFVRMRNQALEQYTKLMDDLECNKREPDEDLIFVKYRVVGSKVCPQVLIEFDFNTIL